MNAAEAIATDLITEATALANRHNETLRVTMPACTAAEVARAIIREHDGCEYQPGKWDLWCEDNAWRIDLSAETPPKKEKSAIRLSLKHGSNPGQMLGHYKLNPPLDRCEYVVSSAVLTTPEGWPETMVFRSDESGEITEWGDLLCLRYVVDVDAPLEDAGYIVTKVSP